MGYQGLRGFLKYVEERGDLLRVTDEVDPYLEIGSAIRETSDREGPVLFFENVKGYDMPVVGGVFSSRRLCYATLQCTRETRLRRYLDGVNHPVPVRLVDSGPCQEVVLTGDQVELNALPNPFYNELDGGPYITLGIIISKSPKTGIPNASMYRLQVKGSNRGGICMGPHMHTALHLREAEEQGQKLPVAVALGVDPLIAYATQASAPYGVDELTLAGGLRGEAVEVVKCRTVDLEVPADAEIVLEGYILNNVREPEGPFGEYPGYYTDEDPRPRPVFEVTAITRRRDAIYQAGLTGAPMTENHVLKELPLESSMFQDLQSVFPNVTGVHYPGAGSNAFLCVVAMHPLTVRDSRNLLLNVLGNRKRGKYNVIVDDDVDIFNLEQVVHAICTRTEPAQDSIIVPDVGAVGLDPLQDQGSASTIGIDATRPLAGYFPTQVKTAPWPKLAELMERQKRVAVPVLVE
jgi:4-hydroxy-3-polyprenylbenzoate decarboxylase/2,5-furandicarboxylate decarboxylase 1